MSAPGAKLQALGNTRIRPRPGLKLDLSAIRGPWWLPARSIEPAPMFTVAWQTASGACFWAALHDFDEATQRHLLSECARSDQGGLHGG